MMTIIMVLLCLKKGKLRSNDWNENEISMCAYVSSGHNNSKIRKSSSSSSSPLSSLLRRLRMKLKAPSGKKSLHGREDWARLLHISYMNEMGPLDVLRFTTTEQTAGFF
ncbi:hypothetical protein F4774DRAFT_226027 [Daldinia eschscholtzii]|nr:hypothetical protein F4774DRAFT_226027 [Daldinia eschscholtzii]